MLLAFLTDPGSGIHLDMIHRLVPVAILVLFAPVTVSSETFPSGERKIMTGEMLVIRGVINPVIVPVGDQMELGKTQSGYFLFTAEVFQFEGTDSSGEMVQARDQVFFISLFPLISRPG